MKPLFDTNILIDYLRGVAEARAELDRYGDRAISIVSWVEVMAGVTPDREEATRAFLDGFNVIDLGLPVAEEAARLRRERGIRLPDAMIWATARHMDRLLVTRNTRDFPADEPGVREPYRL